MKGCIKILLLLALCLPSVLFAFQKGIYVTQGSLENSQFLNYLIDEAHKTGINTFVIDLKRPTKQYRRNIQKVLDANIRYVVRIVVFPHGGTRAQVGDPAFWQKRWPLVKSAIDMGASEVQLDYIRYSTKVASNKQNSYDILKVIQWYKDKVSQYNIPLQIDVFGITIFNTSHRIGQNLRVIGNVPDVICPMVYPSHFEPYKVYSKKPYETIYDSVRTLKAMYQGRPPFRIIPFIETSNYRYPMDTLQKQMYIYKQYLAAQESGADGWYFWSANNHYRNLFYVLASRRS